MADCARYVELLSARLDGELTPAEERELEEHLEVCPACRALEGQLSVLHGSFAALEETPAPAGFAQGVMDGRGPAWPPAPWCASACTRAAYGKPGRGLRTQTAPA